MLENENILCLTMSDWDEPKRSRHHIVSSLSKKNRVVWVEKTLSLIDFQPSRYRRFFRFLIDGICRRSDNLFVVTPPFDIPFLNKWNYTAGINSQILLTYLRRRLRSISFEPTVLWIFSCYAHNLVGKFDEKISLYYCNDFFGFTEFEKKEEEKLCRKVDFIFTPYDKLTREKKIFNQKTYKIPHGVDVKNYLRDSYEIPSDLENIPKPRIGYVGVIRNIMDPDLIRYAAGKKPEWSFVFVGPYAEISEKEKKVWDKLAELENVFFLGGKQVSELPNYLNNIDVATFPYLDNALNSYIEQPLKTFEYLIMGKPIVSTGFARFPDLPEKYYYRARGYDDFILQIETALMSDSEGLKKERIDYAKKQSWENRVEKISRIIIF